MLLDATFGVPEWIDQNGSNALQNVAINAAAGTLTIENGANLTMVGTTDFTNAGSLNIGSTSTLTVGGTENLIQTSTGILSLQVGGSSPGHGYSQLVATGNAQLDGTLQVNLVNGLRPPPMARLS